MLRGGENTDFFFKCQPCGAQAVSVFVGPPTYTVFPAPAREVSEHHSYEQT